MTVICGIVDEARASTFSDLHYGTGYGLIIFALIAVATVTGVAVLWGIRPKTSDRQNDDKGA